MKSLMTAVAMAVFVGSQSASACFFPFFPTYSAGYAPWGMGWGGGYQTASYRYAPASYNSGCCSNTYSASYQSFASPQLMNYGSSSCCNSCGGSCGGTCGQSVNYGGGCGSNCGSDCVGTETRKVPEVDDNYNSDRLPRTFDSERDRQEERDRLDRLRERDPLNERRTDEVDGFGTPNRSGIDSRDSGLGSDRRPLETERDWDRSRNPSRTEEFGNDGFGSDIPGRSRNEFGGEPASRTEPFDPRRESAPLSTPNNRFDPEPLDGFPPSTDTFPPRTEGNGGGGFKPVTEEQPAENTSVIEQNTRKPEMPEINAEDAAGAADEGDEANGRDFLPADETTALRSSHTEILKMHRLAGRPRSTRTQASQVSSSRNSKQRPARWISLPMPVGRERL